MGGGGGAHTDMPRPILSPLGEWLKCEGSVEFLVKHDEGGNAFCRLRPGQFSLVVAVS